MGEHPVMGIRRSLLLCALVMVAGCDVKQPDPGEHISGSGGSGVEMQPAIDAWLELGEPALLDNGCFGCHAGTQVGAPPFLAGATELDVRETLLTSGLVDLSDPAASQIFGKGAHEGPAFTQAELENLLAWIEAEAAVEQLALTSVRSSVR
jgi:hypothetical protein